MNQPKELDVPSAARSQTALHPDSKWKSLYLLNIKRQDINQLFSISFWKFNILRLIANLPPFSLLGATISPLITNHVYSVRQWLDTLMCMPPA